MGIEMWMRRKGGFPLAEGRKRRKTFFSHAAGSMGSSAWGVSGHVRSSRFTLRLPSDIAWPFSCLPMAKEKSRPKTCASKRLEPYNKSPNRRRLSERGVDDRTSVGVSSRRSSRAGSPTQTVTEPPEWAKALLKQQQANAAELKWLQNEVTNSKSPSTPKPRAADPEFRFAGNKKQYLLKREVMEKINEALEMEDDRERTKKLTEGKDLLQERNKHILLAEKYGWDTVACYTAELLASDSDDENKIRKAVKERKQLRDEKKKAVASKISWPKGSGVIPRSTERRVILERNTSYTTPVVAGKQGTNTTSSSLTIQHQSYILHVRYLYTSYHCTRLS